MFEPTPRQKEVRRNVALSAISSFDSAEAEREHLTREDINHAVQQAFDRWFRTLGKRNTIEEELKEKYGSQVSDVKETYRNLKIYNYP